MAWYLPAVLAVLTGLLSCVVLGKYSAPPKMLMRPNFYRETSLCRTTPKLTSAQMELCLRLPDVTEAALQGLQLAVKECQHQFQHDRWNCSSLETRAKNPYSSTIFRKGFKETAFAYAMSSAGVVITVAKACSQGLLKNCGCDKYNMRRAREKNSSWKWNGCFDNLHYGIKFAKKFLDSREDGADIHSQVNLHNNNVGRLTVANKMQIKCKCHGLSGGCEFKTCWRSVPDIRVVGTILKDKFETAILVQQSNLANSNVVRKNQKRRKRLKPKQWTSDKKKHKKGLKNELIFYEKSPNFCDYDQFLEISGTSGRFCNRTHEGEGSCSRICCGRGYNVIKQRRTETCNCKFHWCCTVECQNCTVEEWIVTCK